MKSIKLSIVAALLATTGAVSTVSASDVEVSANMAMTSNYVWRGMTQTNNSPAIQGGFDAGMGGLYAGVWGSNISWTDNDRSSFEADFYAGYAGEVSGLSYDVGYVAYTYANVTDDNNFEEAYLSLGYDFGALSVSGMYYVGMDTATDGYEAGVSVPVGDMSIDATYGDYDEVGNYYSISASKSFGKFDFTVAYTGIDSETAGADEDNLVVTIGTSF